MPVQPEKKQIESQTVVDQRLPYERPHIIFEGLVTTRAGSPLYEPDDSFEQFDLIDLLTGK